MPTPAEDLDTIDDTTPVCDPCLRALDADEEAIAEACDKLPPRAANDQGW
ncbi:MAG: hypothetical protein JNK72_24795 [Myxococcales bacterium]|nr:hypothetical protein [Myxococcales bacterium]